MSFHEDRFPLSIAYGSTGGPGFSTKVTEKFQGGAEYFPRWSQPLYSFNIASGLKKPSDVNDLLAFYLARLGIGNGFRFFDFKDHTSNADGTTDPTSTDQLIGTGDGSTTVFQLTKTYTHGSESLVRNIRKPINGETLALPGQGSKTYNLLVNVAGVDVAASGNWSLDTTTGEITFTTAPVAGAAIRAGFAFDVPVWFGSELDEVFAATHVDFETFDFGDIILSENRVDSAPHNEEVHYGGAYAHGIVTSNISINTQQGRVHTFTDTAGINVLLPDLATLPSLGGPFFYLYNFFGAATSSVRYSDGVTVLASLPPNTLMVIVAAEISGGTRVWAAR